MYKIKVEGAALSKANVKVQDQGLNKAKVKVQDQDGRSRED